MKKNLEHNNKGLKMKSKMMLMSTTGILAAALMVPNIVQAQEVPSHSWNYDTVLGGNVSNSLDANNTTNITVDGGNGFVEGNADIYEGHTVNVDGTTGNTFAYRDNRANIDSTLAGDLNSNMNIVIMDRDGVFFTENSRVDVNGLVATTGDIAVSDIMDGDNLLNITNVENTLSEVSFGFGNGAVINNGRITAADAGLVALVAPHAVNNGVIRAKMGTVALASGDAVTVDMYGDGLVELAVSGELENGYVANSGYIVAEGGVVNMTAAAAGDALGFVVNNNGIIDVTSATVDGGQIVLSGGENGAVRNAGRVVTSAGGSINVDARDFVQEQNYIPTIIEDNENPVFETDQIQVSSPGVVVTYPVLQANGGDINIETANNVEIFDGAINAGGGNINIDNDGVFYSREQNTLKTSGEGTISLRQNEGNLFDVEAAAFEAANNLLPVGVGGSIQNAIDAISNSGAGTNTVDVGAGTYVETVRADVNNLVLTGANAGVDGSAHARGPETVIQRFGLTAGVYVTGDNVTVDGFAIDDGSVGVRVNSADNAYIANNLITGQEHPSAEGESFAGFATGDGVFVQNSTGTTVEDNHIIGMNDDGIHAVQVVDFTATDNVINGVDGRGDEGIAISNATGTTTITENTITNVRRDAIQLINVTGENTVSDNIIFNAGRSGINLVNVDGTNVDNNLIIDNKNTVNTEFGMDIVNSTNVTGTGNDIRGAEKGLLIQSSRNIEFDTNSIVGADEGVVVSNTTQLDLLNNEIEADINGIRYQGGVTNDHRSNVFGNNINSNGTGILVDGNVTDGSIINLGSRLNGNTINAGVDGVNVVGAITGSRVRVTGSTINAERDGVRVNVVGEDGVAAIWYNDEIFANSGDAVRIDTVASGLGGGVTVSGNKVLNGGDSGVEFGSVTNSTISVVENDLINGTNDGVEFGDVTDSFVLIGEQDLDMPSVINGDNGNGLFFAGQVSGSDIVIGSNGTAATRSNQATSQYDTFTQAGATISGDNNGIMFSQNAVNSTLAITDNTVEGAQNTGITVRGFDTVNISDNNIQNNGTYGVRVAGANNGDVTFQGNTLTNNGTFGGAQARFESGAIDMSNVENPNTFINTVEGEEGLVSATALEFAAFETFSMDEELGGGSVQAPLTIVGETLGSTVFTGYTAEGSNYVRFTDGSILDPITGAPIVIDAQDVSFDGVVASSFPGGILPAAELQFIKDRLYDADDAFVNGRGQIFVPVVPVAPGVAPINFEDFLPGGPADLPVEPTAASVSIPGLPSTGFAQQAATGAAGLNQIAPAAGEEAGTTAEDVAGINPEAGGSSDGTQSVTCLNDAVEGIPTTGVTYNFGGSFEDSIAESTACQTAAL